MKQKITCKQAVDYISRKEEGKLSTHQRFHLWRHLAICSLCRVFNQENKIIIKALAGFKREDEHGLTEEAKKEIIEVVLNEKQ